jgi:hypothetical protein
MAHEVSEGLAHGRRILHLWARWAAGTRKQRVDTLARRCEWLTHTTMAAPACQRSVGRGCTSRGGGSAMLGSCRRGDVLRIGIGGGECWAVQRGLLWTLWGGPHSPLVRPGAWSGDEAQEGLITTPLVHRHCVPAIFQNRSNSGHFLAGPLLVGGG